MNETPIKDSLNGDDVTATIPVTPPHEAFDPTSTHTTPSPRSALQIAEGMAVADSHEDDEEEARKHEQNDEGAGEEVNLEDYDSLIDYDYLLADEDDLDGEDGSYAPSSPDYDYLAAEEDGGEPNSATMPQSRQPRSIPDVNKPLEAPRENEYEYVIHNGEEYILGTLMVRVLQAKNVKVRHLLCVFK